MAQDESATEELKTAIRTNDASQVAAVLEKHPELKTKLNQPLPDFHFDSTALLGAVSQRNREMIDVLLKAGADINERSGWWAGGFGVLDYVTGLEPFLIGRGARVDAHAAARLGMLDRLKELISADPARVHARGGDGQTPLHFAASVEIAEYLLANGADIDARDIDHESTPAQYMARERQDVARYLVSRGCQTDLLMAVALGDFDLARHHLDADPASIKMCVSGEWFPKRNPRSGGTIYIWVLGGNKSAHEIARDFQRDEILRLLTERSPDRLKLIVACELGNEAAMRELLGKLPSFASALSGAEQRRLVSAAESNKAETARLMLEAGWPVETQGPGGATALHWAGFHGNLAMARELLRFHPPLELEDFNFHATPMGWATWGSLHGWHAKTGDYAGTVRALLEAGAKIPEGEIQASEAVLAVLRG